MIRLNWCNSYARLYVSIDNQLFDTYRVNVFEQTPFSFEQSDVFFTFGDRKKLQIRICKRLVI